MAHGLRVRRGGAYNRLAEPDWENPLDTAFSKRAGGRWNAPGAYGVLYLNASERMARIQVEHRLTGQPYDVEDLDPATQHDLVEVDVTETEALDLVSEQGLDAVGLPAGYPLDDEGAITHERCHPIGQAAYDAPLAAIACRSAATGAATTDEELAVFDRDAGLVTETSRRSFTEWYLGIT
jgi:hypothetical protein